MKKILLILAAAAIIMAGMTSCSGSKKCPAYTNKEKVKR